MGGLTLMDVAHFPFIPTELQIGFITSTNNKQYAFTNPDKMKELIFATFKFTSFYLLTITFLCSVVVLTYGCDTAAGTDPITPQNPRVSANSRTIFILDALGNGVAEIPRDETTERIIEHTNFLHEADTTGLRLHDWTDGALNGITAVWLNPYDVKLAVPFNN